jgi:hypothetical protein
MTQDEARGAAELRVRHRDRAQPFPNDGVMAWWPANGAVDAAVERRTPENQAAANQARVKRSRHWSPRYRVNEPPNIDSVLISHVSRPPFAVAQIPYAFPKHLIRMRRPCEMFDPADRVRGMCFPPSLQRRVKSSTIDAAATVALANVLRDSDHPIDGLFLENFVWHTPILY